METTTSPILMPEPAAIVNSGADDHPVYSVVLSEAHSATAPNHLA